ncbi:DUF3592 domain-containing protein [Paludibacterium paludis]|uniref:DUF3592 domain-containing protein n=1 Tax=Paludibacterium paludis TaxID=1225769 RepID=A0A918P034_9NEIS|nr:DUF3592 domain-containing protein [Paludibacterium paludis]GGY08579.1 hypothetical protein GCM10011289_09180 [Paludibacterium paludis]
MLLSQRTRTSLLMLGFLLSVTSLIALLLAPERGMRDWKETRATILESRARVIVDPDNPDKMHWEPMVSYRYIIDGVTYYREKVFAIDTSLPADMSQAEDVVRRYPKGKVVPVFYDPLHHDHSVLVKGGDNPIRYGKITLAVLTALIGSALFSVFRQRRQARRTPPSP